jgi:hypothetical protein
MSTNCTCASDAVCTCGCCEGIQQLTPMLTANRPGLPVLSYRVGTHATFLETMLARLSNLSLEEPKDKLATDEVLRQPQEGPQ